MRLLLYRLRNDHRLRRTFFILASILLVSIAAGVVLDLLGSRTGSLTERAGTLAARGDYVGAEKLYWRALQSGPVEVETLIAFIDNRSAMIDALMMQAMAGRRVTTAPVVAPEEFTRLFDRADLSPDVRVLGRFWAGTQLGWGDTDPEAVIKLSDSEPPVRHANRLLARAAFRAEDLRQAAFRFEKEGLSFPEDREQNLSHAIALWTQLDEWDEIRARIDDPAWAAAVGPSERRALAEHDRNWPAYLLWLWPASFAGVEPWPIGLALLAGGLWFAIAASLGGAAIRRQRLTLYALSFVLGLISIYPTLVVITIEEKLFNLRFTGEPVADAIYFVFGVGLREELCKFLLFLPLLPLLRKRGSRIEALICGAMVGLGFAAEENVNYFHRMDVSAALGRFLTANFLHMALTGLVGLAAYDADQRKPVGSIDLNTTFLLAVLIHGAYDFFLASPAVGEYSIFAMTVFVLLSQRFLREVLSSNATPPEGTLRLFIVSITVLTGASYIYAATLAGPWTAFQLIAVGVVGQAILIYMFVMELGGMR
jgi:RsiW-degrading membrane proteinase PrsW (M82 family)